MSKSPKHFKLILVDVQPELCHQWEHFFSEFENVEIHNSKFQEIKEFDCIVSPANSFGLMDGGIDLHLRDYFGIKLQYAIQKIIQRDFYGEQPVGTSIIVFTEDELHPFIAHTPTMRVPADITNTTNVYNAMFAMLGAVANYNKSNKIRIESVLCPGLGTSTGQMQPKEAARQMYIAYKNFLNPTTKMTWENLKQRDAEITNGGNGL